MSQLSLFDAVEIPLSRGFVAVVDPIDADLSAFRWHVIGIDRWPAARRRDGQKLSYMHRVIMSRVMGRELGAREFVDHVDGNPLNNRRGNLRICSNSENLRNRSKTALNSSGYKGVCVVTYKRTRYVASITTNGKQKCLGYFDTAEEAYEAYCEAAKLYHGEFAKG